MRPDIEAIKARAEAATPGPWEVVLEERRRYLKKNGKCDLCEKGIELLSEYVAGGREEVHVHRDSSHYISGTQQQGIAGNFSYEEGGIIEHVDTVFIANARQDIPALLDYISELEANDEHAKCPPSQAI